jgi:energy-converting hydrogenase Eha subunit C
VAFTTLLVLLEKISCIGLHQGGFVMFMLGCKWDNMSHTCAFVIAFLIALLLKYFIIKKKSLKIMIIF